MLNDLHCCVDVIRYDDGDDADVTRRTAAESAMSAVHDNDASHVDRVCGPGITSHDVSTISENLQNGLKVVFECVMLCLQHKRFFITRYEIGVGSQPGHVDIAEFKAVGLGIISIEWT